MSNSIERFSFQGDELEIVRTQDGDVSVPLRRLCEAVGVDFASQYTKLKSTAWARIVIITTHDELGRKQEMACLHRRSIPLWAASINANKVREEIRGKLIAYQTECADVLADHFLGARVDSGVIAKLEQVVDALGRVVNGFVATVNARLDNLEARMNAMGHEHPYGGIGPAKADEAILSRLRAAAELFAGGRKIAGGRKNPEYAKCVGKLNHRLAKAIGWVGKRIDFLPPSKLGEANEEVSKIEREASDAVRLRQAVRADVAAAAQGALFDPKKDKGSN